MYSDSSGFSNSKINCIKLEDGLDNTIWPFKGYPILSREKS
jgi:hypothetical protein